MEENRYKKNKTKIDSRKNKKVNEVKEMNESNLDKVRHNTDEMVDKIDRQAVRNFELNLELNNLKSELEYNLKKLDEHTYCPNQVDLKCEEKEEVCKGKVCNGETPSKPRIEVQPIHGEDCHCSKCCPNPNPNFFQKNKTALLMGVLWIALIVLAIGWSPSGSTFEAIQTSYVDLIVNFFKMGIFAIAGITTYKLTKKKDD